VSWYFAQAGTQYGPVTPEALAGYVSTGVLGPADLVWGPGMAVWQPASTIPWLFAPAAAVPPPPLVPYATAVPSSSLGDDPVMRAILPVGRAPRAIVAGYLGLFSILILPAPLALTTGILAVRDIRRNPRKHGMGRAIFGIVMGALGTIVLAAILIKKAM
jgi:hypothetical protein